MSQFEMHGWVRIADAPPAAHVGSSPRFLLNKDIYL
jgi:hypothetical protein